MVKSSPYSPLDSLVDLACRDGVDIRPTLLRVITDLYVQKPAHTAEEETQYIELALGLIGDVDEQTRAAVAARLGRYTNAPSVVLQRLSVARADSATPGPATRPPAAPSAKAATDDLTELFFTAGAEERRLILLNLDVVGTPAPRRSGATAEAVSGRLESAALQHNATEFARILQRGLSIDLELAARIANDASGEGIVVAAKALSMKADVLQRILLFLNPAIGQSVERVFELAQLYEDVTASAAEYMVAIWRSKAERLRPRYEPALWDDEQANARMRATPAGHRGLRRNNGDRPLHRADGKPRR